MDGKEMNINREYSLEEAIEETKFGKFNYFLIVVSGLTLACGFLEATCINTILPIAQCELDMNNFDKGLLGSISYIGIILSSHFWGFMADTRGRKKIIVPALILSFLFTVISTLSKSFWLLTLFRFLNGFCICAPQTITYAYLGEFHSGRHRARILLVASFLYGIFALANPLNGFLYVNQQYFGVYIPYLDLNYGTWRIFLLMCGVPSIISAAFILFFIPESPKFTYSQGDEARTIKILQRIFVGNTNKSGDEYPVKILVKDAEFTKEFSKASKGFFNFMWSQTVPLFKGPHLKNMLTACYLQFSILVSGNGFYTFFPEILNKVSLWLDTSTSSSSTVCEILDVYDRQLNTSTITGTATEPCVETLELSTLINIGLLTASFSFLWLLISLIINKVGKLTIICTVFFSGGISSILIMLLKTPSLSVFLYYIVSLASLNISVVNSSTVELFPTHLRGMAVSISMMSGRMGSAFGSNFVGLLIKNYCTYMWILPATLSIFSGFLSFTIPNINKRI